MKVALVMTGHMRGYRHAYEGIKKFLLDQHDVDIYISTWDVDNPGRYVADWTSVYYQPIDPLVYLYQPKKIHVEQHQQFYANRYPSMNLGSLDRPDDVFKVDAHAINHGSLWVERIRDMWYIIKKGYMLIDNPKEYDVIMRLRLDTVLEDFVLRETTAPVFLEVDLEKKWVHDLLVYGPPDPMEKYFTLFDYIEPMYYNDNINIAHSDELLGMYLMNYHNIIPVEDRTIKRRGAPWN